MEIIQDLIYYMSKYIQQCQQTFQKNVHIQSIRSVEGTTVPLYDKIQTVSDNVIIGGGGGVFLFLCVVVVNACLMKIMLWQNINYLVSLIQTLGNMNVALILSMHSTYHFCGMGVGK